jgi:hypothetical protein
VKRTLDADGAGPGASVNESFVYDGLELALRFNHADKLSHRYLYGPATDQAVVDEVFADVGSQQVSEDVDWLLTDHQGSVRDVYDEDGYVRNNIVGVAPTRLIRSC